MIFIDVDARPRLHTCAVLPNTGVFLSKESFNRAVEEEFFKYIKNTFNFQRPFNSTLSSYNEGGAPDAIHGEAECKVWYYEGEMEDGNVAAIKFMPQYIPLFR